MGEGFQQQAAGAEARAAAVCWDASVTVNETKVDAIAVGLEHVQGESVNVYLPYRKRLLRGFKFGEIVGEFREPEFFAKPKSS